LTGYVFVYDLEAVVIAAKDGFIDVPGLPIEKLTHRGSYLFPIFMQRLPSPARGDFKRLMDSWGVVASDDSMEVLARSGGVLATDRIELAEFRAIDDELTIPLEFRIAGLQKRPSASLGLKVGDVLELIRQPMNEADPAATMVAMLDGVTVGYVPRQYAALLARHLDAGRRLHTATIRKILLPDAIGAWVVRTVRTAE
jgi:hypothetical protein